MLGWTGREFVRRAIVSVATINAIEDTNVPSSHRQGHLAAIQAALEEGGIEFTSGDEPGVKLKAKGQGEAMIQKRRFAESLVRKRSIKIGGRSTSVALEEKFWEALKEIALVREVPLSQLVTDIDGQRESFNLSSSLRLFVLRFYQDETEELATWRKQQSNDRHT